MSLRINVNEISDRIRRGVSEMSYAQRRVFEHRTGIAVADGAAQGRREPEIAATPDELEALYAQDVPREPLPSGPRSVSPDRSARADAPSPATWCRCPGSKWDR